MPFCANSLTPESKSRPVNRSLSEAQLVGDARRGRPEAFEALWQALTPRLYKTAFRITRNAEDAEDAVQNSLLSAFVHIKAFRGDSAFSTWLTRIVMNSALMIRRKNLNDLQLSSDEPGFTGEWALRLQIPDRSPNPEQNYVQRERETIVRQAVRRLNPRMQSVVEMAQLKELPLKETARVLDISVAAAKGRLFHARAALRKSAALRAVARVRKQPAA